MRLDSPVELHDFLLRIFQDVQVPAGQCIRCFTLSKETVKISIRSGLSSTQGQRAWKVQPELSSQISLLLQITGSRICGGVFQRYQIIGRNCSMNILIKLHLVDFANSFAGQESVGNATPAFCISSRSSCNWESLTVSLTDQQSLRALAPASAWKFE